MVCVRNVVQKCIDMKRNIPIYQSTQNESSQVNTYTVPSTVVRESIASLLLRLFAVEFFIGLFGLLMRIPLLYILSSITNELVTYSLYGLVYFLYQVINTTVLLLVILDWYNRSYVIRTDDIALRSGVFKVQEQLLQYDNIESVQVTQSLLGRILKFGSIRMYNPLLRQETEITNIAHPQSIAKKIQKLVPKASRQQLVPVR